MGRLMDDLQIHLLFWHWWIAAVVFLILEMGVPVLFFLWLGIAAAVVGLLTWLLPGLNWEYQVLSFALLSIVSVATHRIWLRRRPTETEEPLLNRRGEQYIGRVFTLAEPIVDGRGRVKVGDSLWRCEGEDMPAGIKVKVTGIDGIVLKVERHE